MSLQSRPWHFGSDGSSPLDRVNRVGYEGGLVGELISETYETELETLAAWMDEDATRRLILAPQARRMGFAWHQDRVARSGGHGSRRGSRRGVERVITR